MRPLHKYVDDPDVPRLLQAGWRLHSSEERMARLQSWTHLGLLVLGSMCCVALSLWLLSLPLPIEGMKKSMWWAVGVFPTISYLAFLFRSLSFRIRK